jgi:hypothetical protein
LLNTFFLASPATLAVTLLTFAIVILAMTSRYSLRSSAVYGGATSSPPEVGDDDYTYLTLDDDLEPDVINLRHRGTSYTLQFPAYAIGDGILTIGDVRRETAQQLGIIYTRPVKLLYKGRLLRDDTMRARDAGLKQHSEIMCVVSDPMRAPIPAPDISSENSDKDVSQHYDSIDEGPQPQGVRSRRGTNAKDRAAHSPGPNPWERFPEPVHHDQTQSQSAKLAPPSIDTGLPSPGISLSPCPSPNLSASKTPREKLDMLTNYFRTTLEPLCDEYITNPPADIKTRESKHKKLSETTMVQVILKADEIELDGDEIARQQRKALIVEVQMVLKEMDEAAQLSR